jgi:hypothetical protein
MLASKLAVKYTKTYIKPSVAFKNENIIQSSKVVFVMPMHGAQEHSLSENLKF